MAEVTEGLVYRGHPLRRVDNLIYYGSAFPRPCGAFNGKIQSR